MLDKQPTAAVLDRKFAEISKVGVDFGSLPNESAIAMASYTKIVQFIKVSNLKPHNEYDYLIMLMNFLLRITFMFGRRK